MATKVHASTRASLIHAAWLMCFAALAFFGAAVAPAQTTSTWTGGAGNWAPCPMDGGNALWDTCAVDVYPNGNYNAVVQGGPVTLASGNGISIVNLSVASGDSVIVTPGYLDITGPSIVNNGTILNGPGNGLGIDSSGSTTLSGSGTVNMSDPNCRIGSATGATLVNQQMIQGQGALGFGTMAITNQGTISADSGTLAIQPNASGMINSSLIQAQSGATLVLTEGFPVPFNNTGGVIKALNNSTIFLEMNPSGGTLTTAGSGVFTLAPPGTGAGLTSLTNAGTFNVPSGAGLNWTGTINNTGVFNLDGSVSTNGTVTLKGSGSVLMKGGEFNGLNANPLINQQLIHGSGTFFQVPLSNQSIIQADQTSAILYLAGGTTTNTGTLEASGGGTLELQDVVNNSGGTIQALAASTVILTNISNGSVNGGTLTTSSTGTIQSQNGVLDGTVHIPTNAGKLNAAKGYDLFFQGTINNTGTITLSNNSCVILNQPSTLTGSGKLKMSSGTCIFGSGIPFTNQSTIEGSGSIGDSNPMPITNAGTILANQTSPMIIHPDTGGFTNTNTGTLRVNLGSTLNIQGTFNTLNAGTLTGGTYMVAGTLDFPNAVVTNAAGITLIGAAAEIFNNNAGNNALSTLAANASTGSLTLQGGQALTTTTSLTNANKLIVAAGSSFTLGGSYTQTAGVITVDGTLTAPTGFALQKGTVQGKGTLASAVTSTATLIAGDSASKAGKLTITGSYTQNAAGTLDAAIGGIQVGTQYSQLAVSNGAHLNGTLNIKLTGGFVPVIGDVFTILTASVVTGQFSTTKGTSINSSEHFEVGYHSGSVTLTVVSGP